MEFTLREYIEQLNNIKEELKDKPVYLEAPNGLMVQPKIKFKMIYPSLELSEKTISEVHITYD